MFGPFDRIISEILLFSLAIPTSSVVFYWTSNHNGYKSKSSHWSVLSSYAVPHWIISIVAFCLLGEICCVDVFHWAAVVVRLMILSSNWSIGLVGCLLIGSLLLQLRMGCKDC